MRVVRIEEPHDERLRDYLRLTDVALRRVLEPEHGLFMAESAKVVRRCLAAGYRPRSALMSQRWVQQSVPLLEPYAIDVYVVPDTVLEEVTGFAVHRGMLASMQRKPLAPVAELLSSARLVSRSRIAVLEDFVDHTNVGAAFRSAAAMGVDGVLVTPRCADPLYRRAIRVSMGTVCQVPWTRIDPWPEGIALLQGAGYVVAGMTLADGAMALDELVAEDHERLALVFGGEGDGLTAAADRQLDRRVTIPMMHGVDSLNVAASSAVAFYATR
jgi:tRNA G18 (ribose-2'-O)-methylase SpoU